MASKSNVTGAIADRYATALYDLADEQKALDPIAGELGALRAMLQESADLRRLIASPLIDREDQARAMETILKQAGASDLARRFVGVVARNRRLFALDGIIGAFLQILAERRGEVTAEVTSATALSEAQVNSITAALKDAIGAKVAVDLDVDPALIGGLVVKVGSRMVDSSLRSKLQRLQLTMKGTG